MQGKIRVLDRAVTDKIAAGEVVENPASVVKEMIENSVDAGADSIVVEIEKGGKSLIKVIDNGEGMERQDVGRAFLRHATSKIREEGDLDSINSLGFRGEALASIAAVSMVSLTTRTRDAVEGTVYSIQGGEETEYRETGCPAGTCIKVRELFYNTPVRKVYLKSDTYEAALVNDIVTRLALARTDISFRLISNGRVLINTPGNGKLHDAMVSVYGREIGENVTRISCESDGVKVEGLVSRPHATRSTRNYQSFFVNGRYVKDRMISQAVEEAYKTFMMVNRYPVAALFISLDACDVDVNVHPAKLQVRFREETKVRDAVYHCVRASLERGRWIAASGKAESLPGWPAGIRRQGNGAPAEKEMQGKQATLWGNGGSAYGGFKGMKRPDGDNAGAVKENNGVCGERVEYNRIELDNIIKDNNDKIPAMRIVGQFLSTFILAEGDGCIYLIDQHAAHERILYEQLRMQMGKGYVNSQRLLEPLVIELTAVEADILGQNHDILNRIGFELEEFGLNSVAIRAVPVFFGIPQTKEFLADLIAEFSEGSGKKEYSLKEDEVIKMACKKAVKANQRLSVQEIESLVEQLGKAQMPFTCPHGRPVLVTLSRYELEKMFKRIP